MEVPTELIHLEVTLRLWKTFLKSSTGGVWFTNGVAQCGQYWSNGSVIIQRLAGTFLLRPTQVFFLPLRLSVPKMLQQIATEKCWCERTKHQQSYHLS